MRATSSGDVEHPCRRPPRARARTGAAARAYGVGPTRAAARSGAVHPEVPWDAYLDRAALHPSARHRSAREHLVAAGRVPGQAEAVHATAVRDRSAVAHASVHGLPRSGAGTPPPARGTGMCPRLVPVKPRAVLPVGSGAGGAGQLEHGAAGPACTLASMSLSSASWTSVSRARGARAGRAREATAGLAPRTPARCRPRYQKRSPRSNGNGPGACVLGDARGTCERRRASGSESTPVNAPGAPPTSGRVGANHPTPPSRPVQRRPTADVTHITSRRGWVSVQLPLEPRGVGVHGPQPMVERQRRPRPASPGARRRRPARSRATTGDLPGVAASTCSRNSAQTPYERRSHAVPEALPAGAVRERSPFAESIHTRREHVGLELVGRVGVAVRGARAGVVEAGPGVVARLGRARVVPGAHRDHAVARRGRGHVRGEPVVADRCHDDDAELHRACRKLGGEVRPSLTSGSRARG
jgi:hypothetical protein